MGVVDLVAGLAGRNRPGRSSPGRSSPGRNSLDGFGSDRSCRCRTSAANGDWIFVSKRTGGAINSLVKEKRKKRGVRTLTDTDSIS